MGAGEDRKADHVGIGRLRGLGDCLWCLPQPGIDDVEACRADIPFEIAWIGFGLLSRY